MDKENLVTNIKSKTLSYCMLYVAFLVYSLTSVCSKKIAIQGRINVEFICYLVLEVILLGVYAIIWQQVLKRFTLVTAMSSKGIVVVFGLMWSVLLFGEKISIYNIIGAIIIVAGIWMVSSDD